VLHLLAGAFEPSPNAVIITDPSGHIEYVNPQFGRFIGYEREELLGKNVSALARHARNSRRLRTKLLAGDGWHGEFAVRKKSGEEFLVSTYISPIHDATGAIAYYLGIGRELAEAKCDTESQAPEQDPSEAGETPDFVLVVDLAGRILFTSRTVPGITLEEATGSSVFEHVPPEHHARLRRYMRRAARTGDSVRFEISAVGHHFTTGQYVTRIGPIERDGQIVALSFISYDLTGTQAGGAVDDAELRRNEERFRLLAEASMEAVAIHEAGRILEANQALADMFGYDLADVVGMDVSEFVAPESRDLVTATIASGYEGLYQAFGRRKDGSAFAVEVCGKNILYQGRQVRVAAIRDVGARAAAAGAAAGAAKPGRRSGKGRSARRPRRLAGGPRKPVRLSERETEVLELLARGLTNREVAKRLQISARTIDHHVSHILSKLEAPNRTAAAMAAEQTGLLPAKFLR
jgi:PAS domain S-box-containing protein